MAANTPTFTNNPQVLNSAFNLFFPNAATPSQAIQGTDGTGFTDGIRVGEVESSIYNNGIQGAQLSPFFCYDVTGFQNTTGDGYPYATLPFNQAASTSSNRIGQSSYNYGIYGGNGDQTIPKGTINIAPPTRVSGGQPFSIDKKSCYVTTYMTRQGTSLLYLLYPQQIGFELYNGTSSTQTLNFTILINGLDGWGNKVSELVTINPTLQSTPTNGCLKYIYSKKTFLFIYSMFSNFSGTAPSGLSLNIGPGGGYGLPFYIPDPCYILQTQGAAASGPNYTAQYIPGDTSTPTATSGDVRGVGVVGGTGGASGYTQFYKLIFPMYVPGLTSTDVANGNQQTNVALYGLPQYVDPAFAAINL